jgi:hypothetical protein
MGIFNASVHPTAHIFHASIMRNVLEPHRRNPCSGENADILALPGSPTMTLFVDAAADEVADDDER